jgi:YggT family protein
MIPMAAFFPLIPAPLSTVVSALVQFYVLLIIAWAILSWFRQSGGFINEIYGILDKIVSPFIDLFKRFIPTAGGIDFSPFVAIILLQFVLRLLIY